MSSRSCLSKLLENSFFEQEDQDLKELGSKILDTMLMKIAKKDLKDTDMYEQIQNDFATLVINEVKISDKDHLLMCLGEIVKNGTYQGLRQIEADLSKMIKKNRMQWSRRKPNSFLHTTNSSQQLEKNQKKDFSLYLGNSKIESIKKQQDQQQDMFGLNGQNLLKAMSEQSISDKNKKQEGNRSKSYISVLTSSKLKSLLTKNVDFQKLTPELYLETYVKNYNAELNCFIQKFTKYEVTKASEWEQSQDQSKGAFIEEYYVVIPCLLGGDRNGSKITGRGEAFNKKDARTLAALQILRSVYESYPNILNKMIEIRIKESLDN